MRLGTIPGSVNITASFGTAGVVSGKGDSGAAACAGGFTTGPPSNGGRDVVGDAGTTGERMGDKGVLTNAAMSGDVRCRRSDGGTGARGGAGGGLRRTGSADIRPTRFGTGRANAPSLAMTAGNSSGSPVKLVTSSVCSNGGGGEWEIGDNTGSNKLPSAAPGSILASSILLFPSSFDETDEAVDTRRAVAKNNEL
jgi:hypothetical protein